MEKEGERMFLECLDQLEVASAAEVHCIYYFDIYNALHIWSIRAIPTYRVYRLYDMYTV